MFKVTLSLLFVALLTACNSDSDDTPAPTYVNTPSEAFDRLEAQGLMPKLDISEGIIANDSDNNGIRDEIEIYINQKESTTQQQKTQQLKLASYIQEVMLVQASGVMTASTQNDFKNKMLDIVVCLSDSYGDSVEAHKALKELESMTANTKERATAYHEYNAFRNGSVSRLPTTVVCGE